MKSNTVYSTSRVGQINKTALPKVTPWFSADVKPARVGVYEIQGTSFHDPNFRRWNGSAWSATWSRPSRVCEMDRGDLYAPGEDMTGWRGLASNPAKAK